MPKVRPLGKPLSERGKDLTAKSLLLKQIAQKNRERLDIYTEKALRIYNRLNRFSKDGGVDRLLAIAEDGRIDETERQEFDSIMADLQEIVQSGLELAVYCGEEDQLCRK